MADDIQLTPEEQAQAAELFKQKGAAQATQPLVGLTADDMRDLSVQTAGDEQPFDPVSVFGANKDLWGNQALRAEVARANALLEERGFSTADIPGPGQIVKSVSEVGKGLVKQGWNYAQALVGTPIASAVGELTGQGPEFQAELGRLGHRQVAENIAGSETAVQGMVDLGEKAGRKLYRRTIGKAPREWTPAEQESRLWELVGKGQVQEDMSKGHGPLLSAVGGEVVKDLEAAGMPVRPEEVAKLAPGDPVSFWLFGKGFQGAHRAAGAVARTVAPGAVGAVGRAAEWTGGKLAGLAGGATQVAGAVTEATGKGVQAVAPAAKIVAPIVGGIQYGPAGVMGGLATGRAAEKTLTGIGVGMEKAGVGMEKAGAEIAGKVPVTGNVAQLAKDVLQAAPAAALDVAGGVGMDIGLAAATSERPEDTANMAALGTFFGIGKAAMRTGGRAVSGQIAAPREWGSQTYAPASKGMPQSYEAMHQAAYAALTPGQKIRANTIRVFAQKLGTDFFVGSPEQMKALLASQGQSLSVDATGFFTTSLKDASGKPRRVILATDITAAPHESFHAIQDVVGEEGMRQLDNLVKTEYGPQWEQQGRIMAARLLSVPLDQVGANWREVLADKSGWGDATALDKLIRDSQPEGSMFTPEQKQAIADSWKATKDGGGGWRDIITDPAEQAALIGEVGDRYLAREIAAENFDAALKNMGTALKGTGVLRATAHVIANAQRFFGGEPLQGRTSEVGRIPLKYDVFQEVARAGRQAAPEPLVTPRAPSGQRRPAPARSVPATPQAQEDAAQNARDLAASAPETTIDARGGRSQRELLGQVAEAIATREGLKVDYRSAPGEPAAAITSNRDTRRAIIEAFRTMPEEARALWEKQFVPEQVTVTKDGKYQIQGWAPEVLAANLQKLGASLAKARKQSLLPWEMDANGVTAKGWTDLYADLQTFMSNQAAGRTGAGGELVVPQGAIEAGAFKPAEGPAAGQLDQRKADFLNALFHFPVPKSARITGEVVPRNIVMQDVSEATLPGRTSPLVTPKPFTGEKAAGLGVEGREVKEVNPVRVELQKALGKEMPSMIEVIQKINLEHIADVTNAPEITPVRGNTLTLGAGFQPKALQDIAAQFNPKEPREFGKVLVGRVNELRDEMKLVNTHLSQWERTTAEHRILLAQEADLVGQEKALTEIHTAWKHWSETGEHAESWAGKTLADIMESSKPTPAEAPKVTESSPELKADFNKAMAAFEKAGVAGQAQPKAFIISGTQRGEKISKEFKAEDVYAARRMAENESIRVANVTPKEAGDLFGGETGFLNKPPGQFQLRTMEEYRDLAREGNTDTWRKETKSYQGKLGSGLTGLANDIGATTDTPAKLAELAAGRREFEAKSREAMKAGDFDAAMKDGVHSQFFREALETAIGGDAAKYVQKAHPDFVPPMLGVQFQAKSVKGKEMEKDGFNFRHSGGPLNRVVVAEKDGMAIGEIVSTRVPADRSKWGTKESAEGPVSKPESTPALDMMKIAGTAPPEETTAHLSYVEVSNEKDAAGKPLYRGKGIGEALYRELLTQLREDGATHLTGMVVRPEPIALRERAAPGTTEYFVDGRLVPVEEALKAADNYVKGGKNDAGEWIIGSVEPFTRIEEGRQYQPPGFTMEQMEKKWKRAEDAALRKAAKSGTTAQEGDWKFPARGANKFKKAWILPDGSPLQLGGTWHHQGLAERPDLQKEYGLDIPPFTGNDAEGVRESAMQKGFVRINLDVSKGLLVVDARAKDWNSKMRDSVRKLVDENASVIDAIEVTLYDDAVKKTVKSGWESVFNLSDQEKAANVPLAGQAQTKAFSEPAFKEELDRVRKGTSGGQTFNPDGSIFKPEDKAVDLVSLLSVNVPQDKLSAASARRSLGAYGSMLDEPGVAVGVFAFTDPKGKKMVSIDLNAVVPQVYRDNTAKFAKDNDQIAIWDWKAGDEVKTGGQGATKLDSVNQALDALELLRDGEPVDLGLIKSEYEAEQKIKQQELLADATEPAYKRKEIKEMNLTQLRERFPEAVIPRRKLKKVKGQWVREAQKLTSDVVESPLYKNAGSEEAAVEAFAEKFVDKMSEQKDTQAFKDGATWYSGIVPLLKKTFGKFSQQMAELLAASSPHTNPEVNFGYAYDAARSWQDGRFDGIIKKFNEGFDKVNDGSWKEWLDEIKASGKASDRTMSVKSPSGATFLSEWVNQHDLTPRQTNGKLYGMHSDVLLQVFSRKWLELNAGPKTQNFVENLLGQSHGATVDLWADRLMRELGYKNFREQWRIMPANQGGVTDADFAFAQKVFERAAEKMNMKADDLQGAAWFQLKVEWAKQGWGELNLGDYRTELERLPKLEQEYQTRKAAMIGGKAPPPAPKVKKGKPDQGGPDLFELVKPR